MKAEYDFSNAKRGAAVQPRSNTTLINFRIEDEILDWFQEQMNQAGGGDFTELMNDVLRDYVRRQPSPARVS